MRTVKDIEQLIKHVKNCQNRVKEYREAVACYEATEQEEMDATVGMHRVRVTKLRAIALLTEQLDKHIEDYRMACAELGVEPEETM